MKRHITYLLGALVMASPHSFALTLDEYLSQVKSDSLSYRADAARAEGAELQSREADLVFAPELFMDASIGNDSKPTSPQYYDALKTQKYSLGVNQTFRFGLDAKLYYEVLETEFTNPMAILNPAKYWDAAPKLELSLPLWGGGFGRSEVARETAQREQALAQHHQGEAQALNTLSNAEITYWRLSIWNDVVHIQAQALKAAQNILDYVAKKRRMNLGEEADVVQARALVEARALELQIANNERKLYQRDFNRFLNRPVSAEIPSLDSVNYESLHDISVPGARPADRPDVKAAEAQAQAAKANAVLVHERNRPTLDVFGNFALNGRDERFESALREAGATDYDSSYVGLRFKMPLHFGAASDAKAGARKLERAAEMDFEQARYLQEQDWAHLSQTLEEARENLKLISKIEATQKAKLDVERSRFRQGRTTTYQVLLFEQDYSQAAISRAKAAVQILSLQSQIKIYQAGRN